MSDGTGSSSCLKFIEVTCPLCSGLSVKFNIADYVKHLRLFHAHRPDFKVTCGINGCLRSYSNLGSFKHHISFVHNTSELVDYAGTSKACVNHEADELAGDDITNDTSSSEFDSDDESLTSDENSISSHNTPDLTEENHSPDRIPVLQSLVDENNSDTPGDDIPTWTAKDLQKSSAQFLYGIKEKYKLTQVAIQEIFEGATSLTQQCITLLKSKVYNVLSNANIMPSQIEGLEECFSSFDSPFRGLETQHHQL